MSTATFACPWLMIWARLVTHGPTPSLVVRVITTLAPSCSRSARRKLATWKLNNASVYPLSVSVPVVSQASDSRPFQIWWLRYAGSVELCPLWPGSIPPVLPASGIVEALGVGLGELAVGSACVTRGCAVDGGTAAAAGVCCAVTGLLLALDAPGTAPTGSTPRTDRKR